MDEFLQLVNKAFREKPDDVDLLDFLLNITTVISLFLIPGAVLFSKDHVTREYYDVSSAWEASDYVSYIQENPSKE